MAWMRRNKEKSKEFVIQEPGTMKTACGHAVDCRRDWESNRMGKKEWRKECKRKKECKWYRWTGTRNLVCISHELNKDCK